MDNTGISLRTDVSLEHQAATAARVQALCWKALGESGQVAKLAKRVHQLASCIQDPRTPQSVIQLYKRTCRQLARAAFFEARYDRIMRRHCRAGYKFTMLKDATSSTYRVIDGVLFVEEASTKKPSTFRRALSLFRKFS